MKKYRVYVFFIFILFFTGYTNTHIISVRQPEAFKKDIVFATRPVIIKFWAPWCCTCKLIDQPFQELAAEADMQALIFAEVNIQEAELLCTQQEIMGIPTLFFMENGRVVHKEEGIKNTAQFKNMLREKIETLFDLKDDAATTYAQPQWQKNIVAVGKMVSEVVREWTRKSISTTLSYTTYFLDAVNKKINTWLC